MPVRHGRMMVSPFTFYRGAAKIMATDLAGTPTAGLTTQLCGDAHLSNFGVFASPERDLVFDLNDFDETLPGPFEYDVKRMAASFTIAARNNGLTTAEAASVTRASVRAYREAMAQFAADAHHGPLVRAHVRRRPAGRDQQTRHRPQRRRQGRQGRQEGKEGGQARQGRREGGPGALHGPPGAPRRTCGRRTPGTACRRCPSSAKSSTGTTGSSANPRSWSRCGTSKRSTA